MIGTILGLPYLGSWSDAVALPHADPVLRPVVAWIPPVVVAFLTESSDTLPAFILMGIGWLLVMNLLQPRLMQTVGIHPIVVLGSVLIGAKVAGIAGAIFGIPIAAVISAFFFHYLAMTRDTSPVATRAISRLPIQHYFAGVSRWVENANFVEPPKFPHPRPNAICVTNRQAR